MGCGRLTVYARSSGSERYIEVENRPSPSYDGEWVKWVNNTFPANTDVLITCRGFAYSYRVKEVRPVRVDTTVEKI